MNKEVIFELHSPYRNNFQINGFTFGQGSPSAAIIGPMRGNEIQQLYICSQLIQALLALEKKGAISKNHKILVIPSLNHYAMNVGKRFWALDNTDINRMFPGNIEGETTQRIAAAVLEQVRAYTYGIQFASFYMPGDFIPHVRMMETGYNNASLATLFGLKYVFIRKPKLFDKTTLNFNWQTKGAQAFSLYTNQTDAIDEVSAKEAVTSILRFLSRMGIIKYHTHSGYISSTLEDDNLITVHTHIAGIFRSKVKPGDEVVYQQALAEIIHPYEGNVIAQILSPTNGVIFFAHSNPLAMENQVVFKLIHRQHI
ncbi:MAG: succinylglutamate desuccinylase [Firmicutes bacterium HGW-Firmicutes-7]|nr:MAG: succinylglutamate desuccinylase [Firmicutes bacterium HGW-Firmicutes-7]